MDEDILTTGLYYIHTFIYRYIMRFMFSFCPNQGAPKVDLVPLL